MPHRTRVCFVTGTRAEFGLMRSTLRAIDDHPKLKLQIIATGMHLDRRHGDGLRAIRDEGWTIDAVIPWKRSPRSRAESTGSAIAGIARKLDSLDCDVVMVVGDRVEAFAGAAAGCLSDRVVAHVHGGDRALGQLDDSLRHAITKLAHVHFAATRDSADRIVRLGEDRWRVRRVGSPGIDGIVDDAVESQAGLRPRRYAVILLHPMDPAERVEYLRAKTILECVENVGFDRVVIVYPNNDPGARGITRCWQMYAKDEKHLVYRDVPRPIFLGLLRDAAVLVGNSSSGIIEAASFGTPVINIGPRQLGRLRGENVTDVPYRQAPLIKALRRIWNRGRPKRFPCRNIYGGEGTGKRITAILAGLDLNDARLRNKLIAY